MLKQIFQKGCQIVLNQLHQVLNGVLPINNKAISCDDKVVINNNEYGVTVCLNLENKKVQENIRNQINFYAKYFHKSQS